MLSSTNIEKSAIIAIEDYCLKSKNLDSELTSNDKSISWDGNIIYYEGEKGIKNGTEQKIPVQVKGKFSDDLSAKTIKYNNIYITDLENYFNDRGAIYFVVYVNEENKRKIYYKVLLPQNIKEILNKKENQITTTIELDSLESADELEKICIFFIFNRKKQSFLMLYDNVLKDIKTIPDVLSVSYIPKNTAVSNIATNKYNGILNSQHIVYKHTENNIPIPTSLKIASISNNGTINISSKTFTENFSYTVERFKDCTIITINNQIKIKIGDIYSERQNIHIDIKDSSKNSFYNSYSISKLLIALYDNKEFVVDGTLINIKDTDTGIEIINAMNDDFVEYHKTIIKIGDTLKKLRVPFNRIPTKQILSLYDDNTIAHLEEILYDGKHIQLDVEAEYKNRGVIYYTFGDYKIALFYVLCDDGLYRCINCLYNNEIKLVIKLDNGDYIDSNSWLVLNPIDICKIVYNYSDMIEALSDIKIHDYTSDIITQYILSILHEYDTTKKVEYLNFAEELQKILNKNESKSIYEQINHFQIKYRNSTLNNEDKTALKCLKFNGDINVACSACLLLDEYLEFKILFDRLSEDEKESYKNWPIYNIYKNSLK